MRASALLVCLAAASAITPRGGALDAQRRDRCAGAQQLANHRGRSAAKTIEVELGSPDGAALPPPMTVDQEGPTPWLQVAICAGLYTAPSMLVVAPALVDAKIESETGWPASALTVASSLMFAASAPGALVGASAADVKGRRPLAVAMTAGTGACLALAAVAPRGSGGAVLFGAARVAGGLVSGGAAPTCFTWAMELTPKRSAVRAATAMNVLWVGGPLYVALLHVLCARWSWRLEVLGLAAFALGFAALAQAAVPESPEFLASREEKIAARPSSSGAEVYGLVGEIDDEPDAIPEKRAAREAAGPLAALLGDAATRDPLLKLIVVWGCVSMSYYGLTFCAGSLSDRVVANFVLLNAADVPGYALAGYATKRTGAPERILVGFAGAAGAALLGLALGAPTLLAIFGKFCTAGMFQQIYSITTDRFEPDVRATAFGTCRVAAMLATFASPPLASLPLAAAALVFAACCGVVAALTLALR